MASVNMPGIEMGIASVSKAKKELPPFLISEKKATLLLSHDHGLSCPAAAAGGRDRNFISGLNAAQLFFIGETCWGIVLAGKGFGPDPLAINGDRRLINVMGIHICRWMQYRDA